MSVVVVPGFEKSFLIVMAVWYILGFENIFLIVMAVVVYTRI